MTLSAGTRLGPYEIVDAIGAGGMGEVYKARDTRLDRTVAIKVLPPHILADPALRARFEREARAVSSLDHPNICVVHDVGRDGDIEYIVMQYVEGETLAARLARGPIPVGEALRYGAEIAAALDKAHRAGILHRDLKPGNVMLAKTPGRDSSARLLDFGLAKVIAAGGIGATETVPATVSSPLTGHGTIVGTLLYMSPEQLEAREVDARSDIFSFGAVMYEMVTGRRAFEGTSQASIIGGILEREPPPMASLAPVTPPALERVVRKCLAKDRERRWQSAADLCDELSWIAQSSGNQQAVTAPERAVRRVGPWGSVAAMLLAGAAGFFGGRAVLSAPEPTTPFSRHLNIALPDGLRLDAGGIVVSPDGRSIVFVASEANTTAAVQGGTAAQGGHAPQAAVKRLYWRAIDRDEVTPIAGTEQAVTPFFSPDGQSLGYFTPNALMTVSLRGGPPTRVAGTPPVSRGGAWLPDRSILISPTQSNGFVRVSPDGTGSSFTTPNEQQGEKAHLWPRLLPAGNQVLFTIRRGTARDVDASDIAVLDLSTAKWRVVLKGGAFAQYSPTGHLLFVRGGTLSAVPFDLAKAEVSGTPTPIAENVSVDTGQHGAHFAVAPDGTVLFMRGAFGTRARSAVWVDLTGKVTPVSGVSGTGLGTPRISPDGRRAVFDAVSPDGDDEVYIADLVRSTSLRLSNDPRDDFDALWTPDGRLIWTALPPARLPFLVIGSADAPGKAEELLPDGKSAQFGGSVSAAGILAFTQATGGGVADIWTMPLKGERKAEPLVATAAVEFGPEFSPDGRFVAYVSNESGAFDVYVVPYPGLGAKRRVTSNGSVSPAWSRDGRQLYFIAPEGMMAVDVTPGDELTFGAPRLLFSGDYVIDNGEDSPRHYDVSADGKRFLMLRTTPTSFSAPRLHVLFDWTIDLKERPTRR